MLSTYCSHGGRKKKNSGDGAQISGDDVAKTVVETIGKKIKTTPAVKVLRTR
jgi:hypothetical protein